MKLRNRKTVIYLILFLNLSHSYSQNDISRLFFSLPLESSRDSIYSSIKKYGFIEKKSHGTVLRDDNVVKTFSGYLDKNAFRDVLADSIKIQLSLGSITSEVDKYYHNLLIIWSYYHFSNARAAKIFYRDKKIEVDKIMSEKELLYKNFTENAKTGLNDKPNTILDNERVSIAFKRALNECIVVLEYQRNEGEKKLKGEFIKKKELIVRELDDKDLFKANNVEQVPITKNCSYKNQKSLECFKESIARQIQNDIDFTDFNLASRDVRFRLSFVVTKDHEIINIKVIHPNKKLCEQIMHSINKINIIESANNKGTKVNYLAEISLAFVIFN